MLPTAQRYEMGVLSYGPLASGWLSGRDLAQSNRAKRSPQVFDTSNAANARRVEIVDALTKVAEPADMYLATPPSITDPGQRRRRRP